MERRAGLAARGSAMIEFGREVCGNLDSALSREWLETNGLGGFSSSTIPGLNTRRYHGLLTAAPLADHPLARLACHGRLRYSREMLSRP